MRTWIEKHSIALSLILVIVVMGMIFFFSAQTASQSGALSGRITTKVIRLFLPGFDTLPLAEQTALRNTVGLWIRKTAHFTEYALLGFSLILHLRQLRKKLCVKLPWFWAWGIGTAYAVTDELHQGLVAGRHPAVTDVMIDSSGVLFGIGFLLLLVRYLHKRHRSSPGNSPVSLS